MKLQHILRYYWKAKSDFDLRSKPISVACLKSSSALVSRNPPCPLSTPLFESIPAEMNDEEMALFASTRET